MNNIAGNQAETARGKYIQAQFCPLSVYCGFRNEGCVADGTKLAVADNFPKHFMHTDDNPYSHMRREGVYREYILAQFGPLSVNYGFRNKSCVADGTEVTVVNRDVPKHFM